MRFPGIRVRRLAIGRDQVGIESYQPRRVSMKVHRGGSQDIVSDQATHFLHEFALRIGYAFHATSSVVVKPESVIWHIGLDHLQCFFHERVVRFFCHGASSTAVADLRGKPSGRLPHCGVWAEIVRHSYGVSYERLPIRDEHAVFYLYTGNTDTRFFLLSKGLSNERYGQETDSEQY